MRRLFANLARRVRASVCRCGMLCWRVRRAVGAAASAAAAHAVTAGRSRPTAAPQAAPANRAAVSEPPQRGDARVAARARRVSRARRRLRQCRLRRRAATMPTCCRRFRFNATRDRARRWPPPSRCRTRASASKTVGPTGAPFTAPFDLRQAFADIGSAQGRRSRRGSAGRSSPSASSGWSATSAGSTPARTLRRRARDRPVAAGAGRRLRRVGRADPRRRVRQERQRQPLRRRLRQQRPSSLPQGTVEPYVFWRRDVNLRAETGALGSLAAGDDRRPAGWASCRRGSTTTSRWRCSAARSAPTPCAPGPATGSCASRSPAPGRRTLTAEYNFASGDADPADGMRGTFDQLYPTAHDKYGLADQVGWRNIHHVRVGFESRRSRRTPITVNYHSWWLAEKRDALYAASGAPLARVAGGAAERATSARRSTCRSRGRSRRSCSSPAGYAHIVRRPVPQAGDARRVLQRPVRDGRPTSSWRRSEMKMRR